MWAWSCKNACLSPPQCHSGLPEIIGENFSVENIVELIFACERGSTSQRTSYLVAVETNPVFAGVAALTARVCRVDRAGVRNGQHVVLQVRAPGKWDHGKELRLNVRESRLRENIHVSTIYRA